MSEEKRIFLRSLYYVAFFLAILWLVKLFEVAIDGDLGRLGIYPRTLKGAVGIITSVLIHGDFFHLISNTFPLIFLGLGLFYFYPKIAVEVFLWIYLSTGFWVWLIARSSYHLGASGLVYGLFSFLLFGGIIRRNTISLAISFAVIVMYGGMIYGVFPGNPGISWESHLMGFLSGLLFALYFRKEKIYGQPDLEVAKEQNDTQEGISHSAEEKIQIIYHYKKKEGSK